MFIVETSQYSTRLFVDAGSFAEAENIAEKELEVMNNTDDKPVLTGDGSLNNYDKPKLYITSIRKEDGKLLRGV